jgi:hypothetical protein
MSIIALYVIEPTTFTTDSQIESITNESIGPGEVTLPFGVYRLPGDAQLVAPVRGDSYEQTLLTDPKGGPPDPPSAVLEQYSLSQITEFLGGAGAQTTI